MKKAKAFYIIILMFFYITGCQHQPKQQAQNQIDDPPYEVQQNNIPQSNEQRDEQNQSKQPAEKELISFRTPLLDKNSNRLRNIELAIKKINGYQLGANEEFSFNQTVGERSVNQG
jgi:vancomycin resistance protein YoaR